MYGFTLEKCRKRGVFYWKSVGIALLLEWKEGEGK